MSSRRNFLKQVGMQSAALSVFPVIAPAAQILPGDIPEELTLTGEGEDFWSAIQEAYSVGRSLINLNNGGVSPQPKFVQDAFNKYTAMSNESPSYYMWRLLEPERENTRRDLAQLLGCDKDEIVINRNTTEALDTVIFGLNLKAGDEVVLTPYDYPNMRNSWEQRKKRDGIVLKYVDIKLPEADENRIVEAFMREVGPKTKLVHITHMVNYNGQVLPAKEIATRAKEKGKLVMLDGAHTFAHIDFNIRDLNCDFFGTSLHKWLCAPFGSGMMYIRKNKIPEVWPFAPTDARADDDIRKFEAMGTRSIPTEIAVSQAIQFHNRIGIERKYKRLKELTDYWTTPFSENPRFISYTPKTAGRYGSLFTFGIEGKTANEISTFLHKEFYIITSPISWRNIEGCRVSPHVYTTKAELDKLIEGINELLS